jgi:fatty acid-binding protein DegV
MKAILEFNLPDDQGEYELCNKAQEMSDAIKDIRDYLRSKVKYDTQDEKKWEAYDEVYQQFYEIINDYNIKL